MCSVLKHEQRLAMTPAEVVHDDSRGWFQDLMPSSHCSEPNDIRHQGHNSNRFKARFPNPVEERNGDLIGIVPAPILDAVWFLWVGVDSL
jgi:hypothetical protein